MSDGRHFRLAGGRHPGHVLRRQVPPRRLVGNVVQDGGRAGCAGGARPRRARSCSSPSRCWRSPSPTPTRATCSGDLNSRRGRVQGTETGQPGESVIIALVPTSELGPLRHRPAQPDRRPGPLQGPPRPLRGNAAQLSGTRSAENARTSRSNAWVGRTTSSADARTVLLAARTPRGSGRLIARHQTALPKHCCGSS